MVRRHHPSQGLINATHLPLIACSHRTRAHADERVARAGCATTVWWIRDVTATRWKENAVLWKENSQSQV